VVFDSNILISALVFPGKQAEKAISRIIENRGQLFISKPIIDEVLEVLAKKFARDPEELAHVAVPLNGASRNDPTTSSVQSVKGLRLIIGFSSVQLQGVQM
jgi:predicted nucleic acid-binding protein